ncbi:MAG: response regulator transcription factor [Chloroflexi bacterium]|nr:response regulator transcription factor [Chloroflexota bacterium]
MRILVVDDDEKIARMLHRGLTFEGHKTKVASTGDHALQLAAQTSYDLVILDVVMPGLDGIAVCRRLRAADAALPILMLTARDQVEDRVIGLDAGADDYLIKPFAYEELLARVRALLRRRDATENVVLRFADLSLDTKSWRVRRSNREVDALSRTEFDLLAFLMRHPDQVLQREQILTHVWGFDFEGQTNVLDVYIGYLRRKLEMDGETRLIHTVRGVGYVLREE